jgi:ankyrin repeat protein
MRHITRPELLRLFLARGADVNTPGTDGKTPLLIAVVRAGVAGLYKGTGFRKLREANLELVRCLLAAGAEANLPSGGVFPIVSAACALPGTGLATLQAFADATAQTGCCVTPLSVALYYADAVCAELLLSAGANPHTPACGFTPMQLAAALIDPTCCNLLRTPTTPQN